MISFPLVYKNLEVTLLNDTKQGLLDYELQQFFKTSKFYLNQNMTFIRDGETISRKIQPNQKGINFISISQTENTYEIKCHQAGIYLIVKEIQEPRGYLLQIGDLIKLGKIEYQVVELRVNKQTMHAKGLYSKMSQILKDSRTFTCKFCYSDSKEDLFLYGICKCQGNIESVHYQCLKYWIDQNITKEETHFGLSLKWTKAFECNVCKDILPMRIKDSYELFTLERPDADYILLEVTGYFVNRDKSSSSEIYLIHEFINDQIKIGRAQNCDIKASDITVSRHHASIQYKDHNFYLTDNSSKFGTLIGLNENPHYKRDQNLQFEIKKLELKNWAFQYGKYIIKCTQINENIQNVYKCSPSTQHKLTQLPQICKHDDEEEPKMDESFDNK